MADCYLVLCTTYINVTHCMQVGRLCKCVWQHILFGHNVFHNHSSLTSTSCSADEGIIKNCNYVILHIKHNTIRMYVHTHTYVRTMHDNM